ncbi:M28 family metallopeptidase [Sphingomonas jatrophae]|uniref:Zn-dependent amino-or carboxypeptidase, M28 family n=1 Tax=Sphingomonas jatrophae TaxID=1166337 RepID=A0A1I6M6W1_9SPHN|nr:M28 family metallopeptidase [Sphingomonas jatrophae]SFS11436.1 Zn-dependent amino-or carboxypeptidase, M28 family [Sphingomonas jatrophae]
MIRPLGLAFALLAAVPLAAQPVEPRFTPDAFRAHVAFLADDLLEGRDIGSRGHEIAARYVAQRFAALGLKPAGVEGGWLQPIRFQETVRSGPKGQVTISGPAGAKTWEHGTEVVVGLNPTMPTGEVSAPLVFVGYGLEAPAMGTDDYRGLDVTGKIVVLLDGFPAGLPAEAAAHLVATKRMVAAAHGAIGMISVSTRDSAKRQSWASVVRNGNGKNYRWLRDGKPVFDGAAVRQSASANTPVAEAIFAGAPKSFAAVQAEAAKKGVRPRGFALRTSARIAQSASTRFIDSPNVAAVLPGADPKLASEYVVLSAHLDHIGISPERPGDTAQTDRINNGALDNAAGIATMLEVARAMAEAPDRPRRSVLFIATTGEEKGLLGADYYARNPTVPKAAIVGNVDLDMPLLLYKFTDVTAFGADHSTLGPLVAAAVKPMGIALSPDPMPEETIFVRSDHYSFVKQGVPAVLLATGFANGGGEQWRKFLGGDYHHPGDDMSQKIDWASGARYAEANWRITRAMANADTAPRWYKGDFFGDLFAAGAEKAALPK